MDDCFTTTVENGQFTQGPTENSDNTCTFKIKWDDFGKPGKIIATKDGTANACSLSTKTWTVPIKTLTGLTPTITGPSEVKINIQEDVTYNANLLYPLRGSTDPNPFTVELYAWQTTPGLTVVSPNDEEPSITYQTDKLSDFVVKATGAGGCVWVDADGNNQSYVSFSNQASKNVKRVVPKACPIFSTASTLLCCTQPNVTFLAFTDELTYLGNNVSYEWTYPSQWNYVSGINEPALTVKPDGMTDGAATIVAKAFGRTSAPCSNSIDYVVALPATTVSGGDYVCTSSTFDLQHTPATNCNETQAWAVYRLDPDGKIIVGGSPPPPLQPTSGNGTSAALTSTNGTPGNCRIIFTITNNCGSTTFQKDFYAGKPNFENASIDGVKGNFRFVCAGSHWASAEVVGDDDNCIVWQNLTPQYGGFGDCNSYDVYIPTNNGPCAALKATAQNVCGINDLQFYICPKPWGCDEARSTPFGVEIYPNPTSGTINFRATDIENPAAQVWISRYEIFNPLGEMVKSADLNLPSPLDLSLSDLPAGMYFLRAIIYDYSITKSIQIAD